MNFRFVITRLLLPACLLCAPCSEAQEPGGIMEGKPTVVFITADDEYRSREIMQPFAGKLAEDYGFNVICIKDEAGCAHRKREPNELIGAERIKEADLIVLFVRFRSWEPESLKIFMDHFEAGNPAVSIRTSTHAFWEDKTFAPTYLAVTMQTKSSRGAARAVNARTTPDEEPECMNSYSMAPNPRRTPQWRPAASRSRFRLHCYGLGGHYKNLPHRQIRNHSGEQLKAA